MAPQVPVDHAVPEAVALVRAVISLFPCFADYSFSPAGETYTANAGQMMPIPSPSSMLVELALKVVRKYTSGSSSRSLLPRQDRGLRT